MRRKKQTKKTEPAKPAKSEPQKADKSNSGSIRRILDDNSSTILAVGKDQKSKETPLNTTINDALAPLDKMQDIKNAMDKFKYFDLMNKYLPNQDISSIIRSNP